MASRQLIQRIKQIPQTLQKLTSWIFLLKVDRLRRKCYLITLEIQGTR